MHKPPIIALLALLTSITAVGQTSYKGITPGTSAKAEVERILGKPVTNVSPTLIEYKAPSASPLPTASKVYVQYRRDSNIVERIETNYADALTRENVVRLLHLPVPPSASQVNSKGRFEEYFATASIVLTYAEAAPKSGVSRIGYYSRELFQSASASIPRPGQPKQSSQSATAKQQTPTSTSSTSRTVPPGASGSDKSKPTMTTRSTSSNSLPPLTITTGSSSSEISVVSTNANEKIYLSKAELKQLVGKYEFNQTVPSLRIAVVELSGEKLKLTMGGNVYTLVPIFGDDFAVDGGPNSDSVNLTVANKPGMKVHFIVTGSKVENLFVVEGQREKMTVAIAVPKF
jgi:hypothetical protein